MLPIKFNYATPFFLLKPLQSWFHPLESSFDPLGTFLLVLCAFACLTFLPFVHDTFLIKWKARFLFCDCLSLLFVDTPLSVLQCFSSSSFHPHYRHGQSHCVHLKVIQVGGFLLLLSLLKYFLPQT